MRSHKRVAINCWEYFSIVSAFVIQQFVVTDEFYTHQRQEQLGFASYTRITVVVSLQVFHGFTYVAPSVLASIHEQNKETIPRMRSPRMFSGNGIR